MQKKSPGCPGLLGIIKIPYFFFAAGFFAAGFFAAGFFAAGFFAAGFFAAVFAGAFAGIIMSLPILI